MNRKGRSRERDPHIEREKKRYTNPIPSREYILQVLSERGVPVSAEELARELEVESHELPLFNRRLRAMEREGQIIRNRRDAICIVEKLDLMSGTVEGHPDGYGFLLPDDAGPDVFLGARQMSQVLHADRVMVRVIGEDRKGRPEGAIVEVLERANQHLVGRMHNERGVWFVRPENKRIARDVMVPNGAHGGAKPGQVVMVNLVAQPSWEAAPIGQVAEVLGDYGDPGMEIEIALRKHQLPFVFTPEVQRRSLKFPEVLRKPDFKGREDLRALPLVTIDGETARDFDDAVCCERAGKSYRLTVVIADVSHYVKPGDVLDKEASLRGNSVYFPRRVIPMLPEALSNGLCSLNPEVDRLAMACEMEIDARGAISDFRFYPAVIRSQARLTYTEVAAMLADPKSVRERAELLEHIQLLYALYKVLASAREKRGAIDFETIETRMLFDKQGKIEKILPERRNDAHRIIEECMLAANVCASDFLQRHDHPTLYRVHEGPTPRKLEGLREFLKEFGLGLPGGDAPHAKDYASLLERIKERPDAQLLQTVMLRSLQQAIYSPKNVGHFGLAYESYTHFTSPIRRYPDLLVHRAIKAVLAGGSYSPGDWQALGEHCSMTERRADEATRDVVAWLKCYYMQDKIGQIFNGTVSGVAGFGVFVALDELYVEGLVHISELGNDYFHFEPAKHRLIGERTAKRYRLGDRFGVRVARVDLESSRIDFALG
jgi:ribonuclease R